jgi:hypothetical protein
MPNIVHRANSTPPTLYVLNEQGGNAVGWVSAYSDAGATFARQFGNVGNGEVKDQNPNMAANSSGNLYLYTAKHLGQVLVYKKYGASLQQTLQFQKGDFSKLTVGADGNLFAMVTNFKKRKTSGPLQEFTANRNGTLQAQPFRRVAVPYYIATDAMGDVGAAGGLNGFFAWTKKSKKPFWKLNAANTLYTSIAFDRSNNLYVVQQVVNSSAVAIDVYARGATTPTYSITG